MTKKTLEQKINTTVWIMIAASIAYFLCGAWLKSDGPNFDPVKAYDLLKDTLTLSAAFLAPIAAFVLFSDWREQYKEIKAETEVLEILAKKKSQTDQVKELIEDVVFYYEYGFDLNKLNKVRDKIEKHKVLFIDQITQLNFSRKSFENTNFHEAIIKLKNDELELLVIVRRLMFARENVIYREKSEYRDVDLPHALDHEEQKSSYFYEQAEKYLGGISERISQIEKLAEIYRI